MEACRRRTLRRTIALLSAIFGCAVIFGVASAPADEGKGTIRLPAWIDPDDGEDIAALLSFRPSTVVPSAEAVAITPKEPAPFPTDLPAVDAARPVRQLEHAASVARGDHALTRVIHRYRSTHKVLMRAEATALAARADRVGSWALHARGRERSNQGDERAAVADFRDAVRTNPGNLAALHDLGIALASRDEVDEALAAFSSVLRRQPNSPEALRNRATLYLRRDESELAVADCDRALALVKDDDPAYAATLALRGTALHASGRLREAAQDFDKALQSDPDDAATRVARGNVFAEAGFFDQAVSDYSAALQANASSVEAYRSLAWLLATCPEPRLRDPKTAIEAAWRARRLLGNEDRLTLDASAAAHASAGEFGEAVRLQQRVLMIASGDAEATAARLRLDLYKKGKPYVAMKSTVSR